MQENKCNEFYFYSLENKEREYNEGNWKQINLKANNTKHSSITYDGENNVSFYSS